MTHEELAEALEIERAQVEWAFTVLTIIQSLYDLTDKERFKVLTGLCGAPPATFEIDWSLEYTCLADIQLEMNALRWLVTGLDDSSSARITAVLETIRTQQAEQEAQQADTAANDHHPTAPPHLVLPQPDGFLILRLYASLDQQWYYFVVNPERHWSISDLSLEPSLLKQIITESQISSSRPIAIISLDLHAPFLERQQRDATRFDTGQVELAEAHHFDWEQRERQRLSINIPGGFKAPFGNTNKPRTLKKSWQASSMWSVQMDAYQGAEYPMVWNLTHSIHQSMTGSAGQSGFVQARSSVFSQLVDDQTLWLCGTSETEQALPFPEMLESRADSQRCIWQTAYSALDFHASAHHLTANIEPIFNTTPPLQTHREYRCYVRSSGTHLSCQTFHEMMLTASQPDISRRTQIDVRNDILISTTGQIDWCGNTLILSTESESNLTWRKGDTTTIIRHQTQDTWQSTEQRQQGSELVIKSLRRNLATSSWQR